MTVNDIEWQGTPTRKIVNDETIFVRRKATLNGIK